MVNLGVCQEVVRCFLCVLRNGVEAVLRLCLVAFSHWLRLPQFGDPPLQTEQAQWIGSACSAQSGGPRIQGLVVDISLRPKAVVKEWDGVNE